jgi:hypothetical protein
MMVFAAATYCLMKSPSIPEGLSSQGQRSPWAKAEKELGRKEALSTCSVECISFEEFLQIFLNYIFQTSKILSLETIGNASRGCIRYS